MRKIGLNNGYRLVHLPEHHRAWKTGYVYEHIVVMEEKLGRPLNASEVVHHKDENKLNNVPDNLELMNNHSDHAKLHGSKKTPTMIQGICDQCGADFERRKGNDWLIKNYKHKFCSRTCMGKRAYHRLQ